MVKTITNLFKIFNFSLRTQEQIFTQLVFALLSFPATHFIFPFILATLLSLKAVNEDIYMKYINHSATPKDVIDFIKSFSGGVQFFNSINGVINEAYLIGFSPVRKEHGEYDYPLYIEYKKISEKEGATELDKERVRRIGSILNSDKLENPEYTLNYITKKIDFVDSVYPNNLSSID